jgi:hypothetical protein
MKMIKYYWSSAISVLIGAGYLITWSLDLVDSAVTFMGLAFTWAMVAWAVVLIHLIIMGFKLIKKQQDWRHNAISALITFSIYVALILGMAQGYFITA